MVSGLTFKPLVHILILFFVHGFFVHIAALFMPANLENSAVATGLEKVSFHSNLKERQYQRMFKSAVILTHQQSNAQNSPSQALTVHEP